MKVIPTPVWYGLGAAVLGGGWYYMRSQERAKLVAMLKNSPQVAAAKTAAAASPVDPLSQWLLKADFQGKADDALSLLSTETAEQAYTAILKELPVAATSGIISMLEQQLGINLPGLKSGTTRPRS